MPEKPCLYLWVPYTGTCGVVMSYLYAAMYLMSGLAIISCLILQYRLHRAAQAVDPEGIGSSSLMDAGAAEQCSLQDRSFRHCTSPDHVLHCRVLYVCEILRDAICFSLLFNTGPSDHLADGSCDLSNGFVLSLCISVVLVDGQGVISFLLFGTMKSVTDSLTQLVREIAKWPMANGCVGLACCYRAVSSGDAPSPSLQRRGSIFAVLEQSAATLPAVSTTPSSSKVLGTGRKPRVSTEADSDTFGATEHGRNSALGRHLVEEDLPSHAELRRSDA